jgi:hypothetical protein
VVIIEVAKYIWRAEVRDDWGQQVSRQRYILSFRLYILYSASRSLLYTYFINPHSFQIHTYNYPTRSIITMQFFTTVIALALAASTSAAVLPRQANSQSFTGALGGIAATPVVDSGDAKRPFSVKGDTFVNVGAALQRSCDQQFNACANQANGGNAAFSTAQCSAQKSECAGFEIKRM